MKKVLSVFLVVGLIFVLVGCSGGAKGDSASATVKSYLEAIDKLDIKAANEMVEPEFQEAPEELDGIFNEPGSKEMFEIYLSGLSAEIKEEKVDGDMGTVTVLVHPYDEESQSKIIEAIFTAAMNAASATEEEQNKAIQDAFQNIDKESLTRAEKEVTLNVKKIEGKWYIAGDAAEELLNSLMTLQ